MGDAIIGMETRYFAPEITLDFPLDLLDTESTHSLVRHYLGLTIGRMQVTIHARAADADIAGKLATETGSPLLLRRHTMFTVDGQHVLFGEAFYCEPFAFRNVAHAHDDAKQLMGHGSVLEAEPLETPRGRAPHRDSHRVAALTESADTSAATMRSWVGWSR